MPKRSKNSGIALISTLAGILLVASLSTLVHSYTLANVKILRTLEKRINVDLTRSASIELSRPTMGSLFAGEVDLNTPTIVNHTFGNKFTQVTLTKASRNQVKITFK